VTQTTATAFRRRLTAALIAVAVLPVLLLAGLVLVRLSRSFERDADARLASGLDAVSGVLDRMEATATAKLTAVAEEDAPAAGRSDMRPLADEWGRRRDLPMLEIVAPDGTILSSRHWPAGYGLEEQDVRHPDAPRFRVEKVAEGYGAVDRLAVVAEHGATIGDVPVLLRGGRFVDESLLDEVSRLTGTEVGISSRLIDRWIARPRSPLNQWHDARSAIGGPLEGVETLAGESFRWQARPLAEGLYLVVALPRSSTAGVLGGIGRATILAALVALAGALLAASRLARRIAAPVTEELAESRERVLQAERVAAWREMARRLAHELKNPIFPIQLSVETLRRVAEEDASGRRLAEAFPDASTTILEELRALRKIVDEFSQFARMPAPTPAAVDVNEVVDQVLRLYEPRSTGVQIRTELAPGLPPVTGDRDLLSRAIGNLVSNALDALEGRGSLSVRTAAHDGGARIDVEDTGPGLRDEQRARLFTPYYTTKRGGTGLGLAIVQGIVSDHGGRVEVTSTPGRGTAFTLYLPGDNPRS
jgi:signal transduction histidine kinase